MRITSYSLLLDRNSRIPQLVRESSSNFPGVQSLNTPGNIYDMLCHVFHMDQLPEERAGPLGTHFRHLYRIIYILFCPVLEVGLDRCI